MAVDILWIGNYREQGDLKPQGPWWLTILV